jgi:hypothetical protein
MHVSTDILGAIVTQTVIVAGIIYRASKKVEVQIDGRLTELLEATQKLAHLEGVTSERARVGLIAIEKLKDLPPQSEVKGGAGITESIIHQRFTKKP